MIHDPVFCREEAGEGYNLRKSLSQMPAGESGNFFAAFLHLLPVLLLFFVYISGANSKKMLSLRRSFVQRLLNWCLLLWQFVCLLLF